MCTQGQFEIAPHQRNRLAVVYVRDSCESADAEQRPGRKRQREQLGHARAWGWPEGAIRVIDGDVGQGGASTQGRPGWQRLLGLVTEGQVGMLLVSDLSRLSRSPADLRGLLDLCGRTETLLAIDGVLHDPLGVAR